MTQEITRITIEYLIGGVLFTWFMESISTDEKYSIKERLLSTFLFPYFILYIIYYVIFKEKTVEEVGPY